MNVRIPSQLWRLVKKTLRHYLMAKPSVQRNVNRSIWIKGRYGKDYVFQMSHGTQQIKRYEPNKYKNKVNTPLRIRARTIMKLASEEPTPSLKEKIRELYRTYPFYLDKNIPINLRLKNFYFEGMVYPDDNIRIHKMTGSIPNPETDELYWEGEYMPKKTVEFSYSETDKEEYYAVNLKSGEICNVVRMEWD